MIAGSVVAFRGGSWRLLVLAAVFGIIAMVLVEQIRDQLADLLSR